MLHGITLDGFRSFADNTFLGLAPLTVLAGTNNVGKSSVIAAIAAFVQSIEQGGRHLQLRGEWADLGRFDDVVSFRMSGPERFFDLGIVGENGDGISDVVWHFQKATQEKSHLCCCSQIEFLDNGVLNRAILEAAGRGVWEAQDPDGTWRKAGNADLNSLSDIRLWADSSRNVVLKPIEVSSFRYLGPYRAEPSIIYQKRTSVTGPPIGKTGVHAVEYIYRNRHNMVDIMPHGASSRLMGHALGAWWTDIFQTRVTARVDEPGNMGYTLKLDTTSAENLDLSMVGLGLSQTLPILALVLGSHPGDVIAIETPEAHLHPGAQHRLARLLIAAVKAGRQVILETHSEHVVNAVRLAVKAGDLTPEQVAIHFFGLDDDGATTATRIDLDASGRAMAWPEGFFDQGAKELAELLG